MIVLNTRCFLEKEICIEYIVEYHNGYSCKYRFRVKPVKYKPFNIDGMRGHVDIHIDNLFYLLDDFDNFYCDLFGRDGVLSRKIDMITINDNIIKI